MKTVNKMLIAAGAGVVIGGVLGLLFAPKKGKDLRKDITDKGKKVSEEFQAAYKKGKDKVNSFRKESEEISEDFA